MGPTRPRPGFPPPAQPTGERQERLSCARTADGEFAWTASARAVAEFSIAVQDSWLGMRGYHLRFTYSPRWGFGAACIGGDSARTGPATGLPCASCDLKSPVAEATLLFEHQHAESSSDKAAAPSEAPVAAARAWLDAQARGKIVVTPVRHVGDLAELSVEEAEALWEAAARALRECGVHSPDTELQSAVVNAGSYRSHEHLHMKLNVAGGEGALERCVGSSRATPRAKEQWEATQQLPKDLVAKFFDVAAEAAHDAPAESKH
eukprot:m51a1_g6096 hypothetical protein (263) ;mRNA; r:51540-52645